jgi:hypothetical protein
VFDLLHQYQKMRKEINSPISLHQRLADCNQNRSELNIFGLYRKLQSMSRRSLSPLACVLVNNASTTWKSVWWWAFSVTAFASMNSVSWLGNVDLYFFEGRQKRPGQKRHDDECSVLWRWKLTNENNLGFLCYWKGYTWHQKDWFNLEPNLPLCVF